MRCPIDFFCKDAIFHIYNHAIGNENLFLNDSDYILLLDKLNKLTKEINVSIFAYCLMPNHFHFIIRQDGDVPIYKMFNRLFSTYVQQFNKKHNRHGRLLRTPLQHIFVDSDQYLIYVSQYIHLNPVKAQLVTAPEDWPYSNYPEWIGIRNTGLFNSEKRDEYFNSPSDYQKSLLELKDLGDDFSFLRLVFKMREKKESGLESASEDN